MKIAISALIISNASVGFAASPQTEMTISNPSYAAAVLGLGLAAVLGRFRRMGR